MNDTNGTEKPSCGKHLHNRISLVCGKKHLHDCIIMLRGNVLGLSNSLSPSFFLNCLCQYRKVSDHVYLYNGYRFASFCDFWYEIWNCSDTVPTMFRQCDIVCLSFYYTATIDATTRLINHLNVHLSNNSKSVSGKISMERKITNLLSLVGGSNFEYHNV
jgi:hypothetical protein